MTLDVEARMELEAARSLLRALKHLEDVHNSIRALLPSRAPESEQHWFVEPGEPVPPNPAPDLLSSAAWQRLVRLGQQHMSGYRRMRWSLLELQQTCSPQISEAATELVEDVLDFGHVLHVLGPQQDAADALGVLHVDAELFVDVLRDQHGLPTLSREG